VILERVRSGALWWGLKNAKSRGFAGHQISGQCLLVFSTPEKKAGAIFLMAARLSHVHA